jgi:sulfoxide reductase heme-binding subunit YedZ
LNTRRLGTWLAAAAYLGAAVPLAVILWDYWQGTLSADPIREVQLRTGRWALTFLLASLAPTPLFRLTGWSPLLALRRSFGLAAFAYALMHFLNFIWLDYGFNFTFLRQDLLEKRYALAGLAAFVLMVPAFVATFRGARRRLGAWWSRLRWVVYTAAVVDVVHFIWSIKVEGYTRSLLYAVVLAVLLAARLPFVARRLTLRRASRAG